MTDTTNEQPMTRAGLPFGPGQTLMLIFLGALLWFIAALLLQVLGPMGIYDGSARIILYGLIIPGTVPFILIAVRVAGVGRDHFALAVALMTAAATLLDGVALAWFPALYGGDVTLVAHAGATILWGAGVGLVLGFLFNRTELV